MSFGSKSLCRACLSEIKTSRRKISLFNDFVNNSTKKNEKVLNVFQKYTSIELQRNDCLPKYICSECFRKLEDFHEFAIKCNESNIKLLEKKTLIEEEMAVSNKFKQDKSSKQSSKNGMSFDEIFLKKEQIVYEHSDIDTEPDAFQTDEDSDFSEKDCKTNKDVFRVYSSSKRRFKCNFCEASFQLKTQYDAHLRNHAGLKPYPCTKCDKAFSKVKKFKEHILSHLIENDKRPKFICEPCGKTFFFKVSLRYVLFTFIL